MSNVISLYPNAGGGSSTSTSSAKLTEDRLNLFCPSTWSEITKDYDIPTFEYFGFSRGGALPANAGDARWLVVGTELHAVTGITSSLLSTGINLLVYSDQSLNKYQSLHQDTGTFVYITEDDEDGLTTYLTSVTGGTNDMRWYTDNGGELGDLILTSVPFYIDPNYAISPFYDLLTTIEGYYKNISSWFFGVDAATHYIADTDLANYTFNHNEKNYNGSSAWVDADGTGEELTRKAELPIGSDLIIYNDRQWSNTEYSDNDDGFVYAYSDSCIVIWKGEMEDIGNDVCDFAFADLTDETEVIKHEMHNNFILEIPYVDEINAPLTTLFKFAGEYKNKGRLLGLPNVDDTETKNNDFHITAEIILPYRKGTLTCELKYVTDGDISFMQGIAEINTGRYLYIRAMDNALFDYYDSPLFSGFVENYGTSAIAMFVADATTYTDNNLHDFIDNVLFYAWSESGTTLYLRNLTKVMINTPSFSNLSYIESDKTPTTSDILTGKEAWANGVKIVGEGAGGGGSSAEYNKIYFNASDLTQNTSPAFYYISNSFLLGINATTFADITGNINIGGTDYSITFEYDETQEYMIATKTVGTTDYIIYLRDNYKCVTGSVSAEYGNSIILLDAKISGSYTTIPTDFVLTLPVPNTTNSILASKTISGDYDSFDDGYAGVREVTAPADTSGYTRVSGVPDGAALLAAATNITVGEVEYMPIYILINYANTLSDTYTKTGTGVSTGADAYLFSDAPTTIEVGTSVTHTWDLADDIVTVEGMKCRWVMAYAVKAGYVRTTISIHLLKPFELIGGTNLIAYGVISGGSSGTSANYYLRFIDLSASSYYSNNVSVSYAFSYLWAMRELILPENTTTLSATASIQECRALIKLTASGLTTISNNYCVYLCQVVASINLPELVTITGTDCFAQMRGNITKLDLPKLTTVSGVRCFQTMYNLEEFNAPLLATVNALGFCTENPALKYIDLSSVSTLTGSSSAMLNYCKYVKLDNGFNISGWGFTGVVTKDIQWFYDLAGWLADRSSGTAGTIILGADNLAILNSLYLEDGTTPLTSIYDAKNWTRS